VFTNKHATYYNDDIERTFKQIAKGFRKLAETILAKEK
jgi:hypothetical protein